MGKKTTLERLKEKKFRKTTCIFTKGSYEFFKIIFLSPNLQEKPFCVCRVYVEWNDRSFLHIGPMKKFFFQKIVIGHK
jgi:hypothetical protein